MIRFRYRLSWLLLLPVVLAAVVWWFKPPTHASYDYLADKRKLSPPSVYHVQEVYLNRKLLLHEIQNEKFAIVYFGAWWSPNSKLAIQQLHQVSELYRGRLPFFICEFNDEEYLQWFPGTKISKPGTDCYLFIVQRGVITDQFPDFWLSAAEIAALMKRILPWSYQL